mmetsp:Transcript_14929/g.56666  ORF Transcript_14929/g.56666 Transcript_14929/m.56666 type:complete len:268 (+) Transcript_14929:1381-2184(+)
MTPCCGSPKLRHPRLESFCGMRLRMPSSSLVLASLWECCPCSRSPRFWRARRPREFVKIAPGCCPSSDPASRGVPMAAWTSSARSSSRSPRPAMTATNGEAAAARLLRQQPPPGCVASRSGACFRPWRAERPTSPLAWRRSRPRSERCWAMRGTLSCWRWHARPCSRSCPAAGSAPERRRSKACWERRATFPRQLVTATATTTTTRTRTPSRTSAHTENGPCASRIWVAKRRGGLMRTSWRCRALRTDSCRFSSPCWTRATPDREPR